jgi:hypothetical protein
MNLVATTFASQPVCNATRAAHALHSTNKRKRKHCAALQLVPGSIQLYSGVQYNSTELVARTGVNIGNKLCDIFARTGVNIAKTLCDIVRRCMPTLHADVACRKLAILAKG